MRNVALKSSFLRWVLRASAAPLPKADVITMGMILHDSNLEKKMKLIRAAYDALPPGGAFIAVEALIDNARRKMSSVCSCR
jgi:transcriptional/translational regulatory protein YebC/TACO1